MSNVTRTPPKVITCPLVVIDTSSSGSNTVVAAKTGATIRVLSLVVVAAAANTIKLMSSGTSISGLYALAANGGLVLPYNEHGWGETASGEALNLNLSAATAVGATIQYIVLNG